MPKPPGSEAELLERARSLAGSTLGTLAERLGRATPDDLRRAKGWAGTLLETALGATAGSRAMPDFPELGVELKTLPVSRAGKPVETTFVCTIALLDIGQTEWENSRLLTKLRRVLWVPIEGERSIRPGERRIGQAMLWSPDAREEAALREDWEELAGLIGCGKVETISGHLGKHLQVRPKARDSKASRQGSNADGSFFDTLPRGFYLRTSFTEELLRKHFALPRASVA